MAEQPIRKDDIIDGEGIKKTLQEIIALLESGLKEALTVNAKSAEDLSKVMQKFTATTDEGRAGIAEAGKATAKLTEEQRQLININKQLEREKAKLNILEEEGVQGKVKELAQLKKSNKERQQEIIVGKAASDSYSAMAKKLRELREAWRMASEEGRNKLTPEIQRLDSELRKLDKSVGQHYRNVGNYKSALTGIGKQFLAVTGLAGGLTVAFKGLQSIINSTQAISDRLAHATSGMKFGFDALSRSIATMDFSHFFKNIHEAIRLGIEYSKILDDLGDRQNAVAIREAEARIETAALMKVIRDQTKAEHERVEAAEKILAIEDDLAKARVSNAKILFDTEMEVFKSRSNLSEEEIRLFLRTADLNAEQIAQGEKLLEAEEKLEKTRKTRQNAMGLEQAQYQALGAQIEAYEATIASATDEQRRWADIMKGINRVSDQAGGDIDKLKNAWIDLSSEQASFDEQTARVATRMSALLEKQAREEGKLTEVIDREQEARTRAVQSQAEQRARALDKEMKDAAKNATAEIADAIQVSDKLVDIKLQEITVTQEALKANAEFQKELNREVLAENIVAMGSYVDAVSDMSFQISGILSSQKERELSAAGDNAEQREEIEKKYFRREQTLAIARAVIDGALGIQKIIAQTGVLAGALIPAVAANTVAQVALIASQKFAEGGFTGKGTFRDETGERVAGIVHEDEFVLNKKVTKKYRPLVEAIHEDDPRKIVSIVENGHFHEVFAGMNYLLKTSVRQDPYTRMMYQLMKNAPLSYLDSAGNTVIERGGVKTVIKKNV